MGNILLERVVVGDLQENTYIISKDLKECVLIDPGAESEKIDAVLESHSLKVVAILLTHGHFDHIGCVSYYASKGAKVYMNKNDEGMLSSSLKSLAFSMGIQQKSSKADFFVNDGDIIKLASMNISVINTPGHTAGGTCYIVENKYVFSGDTIFLESYGRYDFPSGSLQDLKNSINKKLFSLDGEYIIYPGHGDATSLKHEKECNPIKYL